MPIISYFEPHTAWWVYVVLGATCGTSWQESKEGRCFRISSSFLYCVNFPSPCWPHSLSLYWIELRYLFITFLLVTAVTHISITLSCFDVTVPLKTTVHLFFLSCFHHQVWNALIPHLPLRVLLQNLKRLGRLWFIKGNQPIVAKILDALNNQSAIGESNLHPAHVFVTLRNYESLGKYVSYFLSIPIHALWLSYHM